MRLAAVAKARDDYSRSWQIEPRFQIPFSFDLAPAISDIIPTSGIFSYYDLPIPSHTIPSTSTTSLLHSPPSITHINPTPKPQTTLHALPNPANPHPHIHPHKHNHRHLSQYPPSPPSRPHQPQQQQHTLPPSSVHALLLRLPIQQFSERHDGLPDQEERGRMAGGAVAGAVQGDSREGHRGAVYGRV